MYAFDIIDIINNICMDILRMLLAKGTKVSSHFTLYPVFTVINPAQQSDQISGLHLTRYLALATNPLL
jgi:hypothetical protein